MGTSPIAVLEGHFDPNIPQILPHDRMYKIQIGTKLFKISGASLSSDGPSYFTNYFRKRDGDSAGASNLSTTSVDSLSSVSIPNHEVLFIDRSAEIFDLIYQHLQGYFLDIKDEVQYTMLLADAIYYRLPRLKALLRESEYYYTRVGSESFKIPKSLFKKNGDSPNYFQMTSETLYLEVENLIVARNLLRPPPHSYSYVARCPEYFKILLTLLGGSQITMDDNERESLIKECRYYRFLNLEQRLIKCAISYNPILKTEEITIRLQDISRKGLYANNRSSVILTVPNDTVKNQPFINTSKESTSGANTKRQKTSQPSMDQKESWNVLGYKRPYLDETSRDLLFQIDSTECSITFSAQTQSIYLDMVGETARKFELTFGSSLRSGTGIDLQDYCVNIPSPNGTGDLRHVVIPAYLALSDFSLNGSKCQIGSILGNVSVHEQVIDFTDLTALRLATGMTFHVSKSVWKLCYRNNRILLIAVRTDAFRGLKEYCALIDYL
ncbi:hypothetical protein KAFR_0B05620 [Kazachstania africana CBS 2517]|uniref:BTB domain-containing protein n=1 Tax=Kazachstania africana (strain ATCC 22294 / BCRC 22015 / CBS 2517 / CECT 1963 / NBRC 1671 / NRRL Y-8276) TaxID=1071382 RepID=H2AR57_KAZAF|nr:hypothetical protein KAFR_0B05620 [Kazachstania africana CBS 2517]CCF56857.1 hypothetical protein KAFR_0B05620 [Kazachstania africana CBS 2517]